MMYCRLRTNQVFVGEDSTARFSGDFSTADVGIRSVPDEYADFATYDLDGGCVRVGVVVPLGHFRCRWRPQIVVSHDVFKCLFDAMQSF